MRGLRLLSLLALLLPACGSLEIRDPPNETARDLRRLVLRNTNIYGGTIQAVVDPHGIATLTITSPEPTLVPKKIVMDWDRKGILRHYQELPMVAQINSSDPMRALWLGIALTIRSVSNLAGTIGLTLVGLGTERGLSQDLRPLP